MSLAIRAVRGAVWNFATGIGTRVLTLIGTLVLTRFVAPNEYGEVSAATVCVLTAHNFSNVGFGSFVIARKAKPEVTFQAMVLHVGFGALAIFGVWLFRYPLGTLLNAPAMVRFVPGIAVAMMIEKLGYIPERTLVRELQFRRVATIRALGEITFTAIALTTALSFGGMGIVYGNIARSTLVAGLMVVLSNRREWLHASRLQVAAIREMFAFGIPLSVAGLTAYVASNWDYLLVSRLFGPATMGIYKQAYSLADTPTANVAEHIGDVLFPSFVHLEAEDQDRALVRSSSLMALVVFPLAAGLGSVAPTAVSTLLAPSYAGVANLLPILCVVSIVQPMTWTTTAYLQARQRTGLLMGLSIAKAALLLVLIPTLGRFSPEMTCVSVGLAFVGHAALELLVIRRIGGVSITRFVTGTLPALLACVPMVVCVLGVRSGLRAVHIGPGWLALIAEVAVGGVAYIASAFVIARSVTRDFLELLRRALRR